MATIEKRGNSYRITVSQGYDLQGKQIRSKMTWTPDPGMTERQIQKELNRQAVLFEEKANHVCVQDGNIRLAEFIEIFFEQYAERMLKPTTVLNYRKGADLIVQALGHLRLADIKPGHINAFYANIQEPGVRKGKFVKSKIDFGKVLEDRGSVKQLVQASGSSVRAISNLKQGKLVRHTTAEKVAAAMNVPKEELFEDVYQSNLLAPGSIANIHATMLSLFQHAVKWGYITYNPAKAAEVPKRRNGAKGYLDEPEVRRLLEVLADQEPKWSIPIKFALFTGLRRAELLGLRWCDVDIDARIIHVRQTWNQVHTKECYVDTPKTTTSERTVKISNVTAAVLLEAMNWQKDCRELVGDNWDNADDRVFTDEYGHPLVPNTLSFRFKYIVSKNGFSDDITLHSLRHTYASLMIASGIPLVVVSRQLGHTQISTTCNIYAHMIASAEAKAAEIFDRFETPKAETTELPTKKKTVG